MTQLEWNAVGERYYEVGVDRGVLYVGTGPGVPWNGLISVSEEPNGGEAVPYYIDGIKYLNEAATVEFEATIQAFMYPREFGECDGTKAVTNGLYSTQQERKPFALTYRTRIGNDTDGADHGYKIHVVYNAMATPATQEHSTIAEDIDPQTFSWKLTTKDVFHASTGATSHLIIDSRDTPSGLLDMIENILYGFDLSDSHLPLIDELTSFFTTYDPNVFDAGAPSSPVYIVYDGGPPDGSSQTLTLNGGAP